MPIKATTVRIPPALLERVNEITLKRYPELRNQSDIINRALEIYVNDADSGGKTAKLSEITELLREVLLVIHRQHTRVIELLDKSPEGKGEY